MTDHHPLQRDLAIRERAVAEAAARVEEVDRRLTAAQARASELGNAAAAARDALRAAAGDGDAKGIAAARKALRSADEDYEACVIELEGVGDRVAKVEEEHALRRREMCRVGSQICEQAAQQLEANALEVFAVFAALIEQRHALALLASNLATEANGRYLEPIRCSDKFCLVGNEGQGSFGEVLATHHLGPTFAPKPELQPARLESLLELKLPRVAEAAE